MGGASAALQRRHTLREDDHLLAFSRTAMRSNRLVVIYVVEGCTRRERSHFHAGQLRSTHALADPDEEHAAIEASKDGPFVPSHGAQQRRGSVESRQPEGDDSAKAVAGGAREPKTDTTVWGWPSSYESLITRQRLELRVQ